MVAVANVFVVVAAQQPWPKVMGESRWNAYDVQTMLESIIRK